MVSWVVEYKIQVFKISNKYPSAQFHFDFQCVPEPHSRELLKLYFSIDWKMFLKELYSIQQKLVKIGDKRLAKYINKVTRNSVRTREILQNIRGFIVLQL